MPTVLHPRRSEDEEWHELEAALSVAYAALTEAQVIVDHLDPTERRQGGHGLSLGQTLAIILTMLDAYLDPPGSYSVTDLRDPDEAEA